MDEYEDKLQKAWESMEKFPPRVIDRIDPSLVEKGTITAEETLPEAIWRMSGLGKTRGSIVLGEVQRKRFEEDPLGWYQENMPMTMDPSSFGAFGAMVKGAKGPAELAKKFRLIYNGPQEGVSGVVGHLMTDPKTKGTFMVKGAEPGQLDVAKGLKTLRNRFKP